MKGIFPTAFLCLLLFKYCVGLRTIFVYLELYKFPAKSLLLSMPMFKFKSVKFIIYNNSSRPGNVDINLGKHNISDHQ